MSPESGDVVFTIRDEENGEVFLYARKSVLRANSTYFNTSKSKVWLALTLAGFGPEWDHRNVRDLMNSHVSSQHEQTSHRPEANLPTDSLNEVMEEGTAVEEKTDPMALDSDVTHHALQSAVGTEYSQLEQRTIIHVDDIDFDTMHNLLSYLYTGCVNLHYPSERSLEEDDLDLEYPETADAFLLYRAANMYMVEALETRCYHYLRSTCTEENIIERLFDTPGCAHHDKIRDMYLEYVYENFETIKTTKQWEEMLLGMKDCTEDLVAHKSKILLKISKMTFGVK